ncbi:nuclear transport factor 2 family protein [Microbulbifer elongatus]|uniref:Nuclear transport factor 2 family protein n=1 Tax=Microbulbifer elongatus TaxID=86173 RepID=A0ABT1NXR8_9GAMM|nr:nuclear transport factor 2 family protein [Microbulbifer elongatus]MCQ3828077.1 nuclear transport factor 2 family protein [Microbulbifer elongatus]
MRSRTLGCTVGVILTLFQSSAFADERAKLNHLLNHFLAGAADDIRVHQRFWADDLIYTSSSGQRFGKAEILAGMKKTAADKTTEEESQTDSAAMRYRAEATDIRLLGDTAIVAFRLIAEPQPGADRSASKMEFFNTGTFIKRDGEWRALAWQATKIPAVAPASP